MLENQGRNGANMLWRLTLNQRVYLHRMGRYAFGGPSQKGAFHSYRPFFYHQYMFWNVLEKLINNFGGNLIHSFLQ